MHFGMSLMIQRDRYRQTGRYRATQTDRQNKSLVTLLCFCISSTSQIDKYRERNLVFYAQSSIAVIIRAKYREHRQTKKQNNKARAS